MKKRVDLKKRLDGLRGDPEPPVTITVQLDGDLYLMLKRLAEGERATLEAYISAALSNHVERALGDTEG